MPLSRPALPSFDATTGKASAPPPPPAAAAPSGMLARARNWTSRTPAAPAPAPAVPMLPPPRAGPAGPPDPAALQRRVTNMHSELREAEERENVLRGTLTTAHDIANAAERELAVLRAEVRFSQKSVGETAASLHQAHARTLDDALRKRDAERRAEAEAVAESHAREVAELRSALAAAAAAPSPEEHQAAGHDAAEAAAAEAALAAATAAHAAKDAARAAEVAAAEDALGRATAAHADKVSDIKAQVAALQTGFVEEMNKRDAADAETAAALASREVGVRDATTERDALRERVAALSGAEARVVELRRQVEELDGHRAEADEARAEAERLRDERDFAQLALETSEAKGAAAVAAATRDARERAEAEWSARFEAERTARRKAHDELMEIRGNIRVVCRCRPLVAADSPTGDVEAAAVVVEFPMDGEIVVTQDVHRGAHHFEYDAVFGPTATQKDCFGTVKPMVTSFMDGYNVCIFAYGQSGAGKTHTMDGPATDRGCNWRAVEEVFLVAAQRQRDAEYTFQIHMLEIYNETVRDLLVTHPAGGVGKRSPPPIPDKLEIRASASGDVHVPGLTARAVQTIEDVEEAMAHGQALRVVAGHNLNEHSSRSHLVLTLRMTATPTADGGGGDATAATSKLHLVDLAGSERISKTEATGARLREARAINKSLAALGDVVAALSKKSSASGHGTHVPFRNSKLTYLLQDALGGGAKVLMFANVSPSKYNCAETLCSLNFASRCRNVALGAASAAGGGGAAEVARLRARVADLEEELGEK